MISIQCFRLLRLLSHLTTQRTLLTPDPNWRVSSRTSCISVQHVRWRQRLGRRAGARACGCTSSRPPSRGPRAGPPGLRGVKVIAQRAARRAGGWTWPTSSPRPRPSPAPGAPPRSRSATPPPSTGPTSSSTTTLTEHRPPRPLHPQYLDLQSLEGRCWAGCRFNRNLQH